MIKYVEFEGNKYPCKVTMGALADFQEETGRGLEDLEMLATDLSLQKKLFWFALKEGLILQDKNPEEINPKLFRQLYNANAFKISELLMDFFQEVEGEMKKMEMNIPSLKKKAERKAVMGK